MHRIELLAGDKDKGFQRSTPLLEGKVLEMRVLFFQKSVSAHQSSVFQYTAVYLCHTTIPQLGILRHLLEFHSTLLQALRAAHQHSFCLRERLYLGHTNAL